MNKLQRNVLTFGIVWNAVFLPYNLLRIWAELWSGDGVSGVTVALAIVHLACLCYLLIVQEREMAQQDAQGALNAWRRVKLRAGTHMDVVLQRIDRRAPVNVSAIFRAQDEVDTARKALELAASRL